MALEIICKDSNFIILQDMCFSKHQHITLFDFCLNFMHAANVARLHSLQRMPELQRVHPQQVKVGA